MARTQFADFHGHGWMFRAVFKRDREGYMLDAGGERVKDVTPAKLKQSVEFRDNASDTTTPPPAGVPVHLKDIHLEKGMHCVDCHFRQDAHGNGNLYNEPRAAVEITCVDCHGSIRQKATLLTSGPAAPVAPGQAGKPPVTGRNLTRISVRDETGAKIPLFQRIARDRTMKRENGKDLVLKIGDIVQNSMVVPGRKWRVTQTIDTITPDARDYSPKSRYAKTMLKD